MLVNAQNVQEVLNGNIRGMHMIMMAFKLVLWQVP